MTKNNRFANRVTTIKGETINLETLEKNQFELEIPYVRSFQKALEIATEKLSLNEDTIINPKKFEVINEPPKPIKYNDGKIYDLAYNRFDTEEEAKEASEIDNTEMRVITWYEINGQIWAIDNEENYITEFYADETPINMTKVNARDFLKMSYEDLNGNKVLGVHNCQKHEKPMFCVITSDNLQKCIES